jgi:hypothetical protein
MTCLYVRKFNYINNKNSPVLYGTLCGPYLWIDTYTKVMEGKATCGLDATKIGDAFGFMGCVGEDATRCVNACVCSCCPCVVICWRGEIRAKYGIDVRGMFYTKFT